jgi:hypothetical protein
MSLSNTIRIALAGLLGLGVGAATVSVIMTRTQNAAGAPFKTLEIPSHDFGLGYAAEAIFSDLPMPKISSVSGKYKFVASTLDRDQIRRFGYVIDVAMDRLELSKVPKRYLKEKKEIFNGVETTVKQFGESASYGISFVFKLKDKDGFELKSLKSDGESKLVKSGKTTRFQSIIDQRIPQDIVDKTSMIELYSTIETCESCLPMPK